MYTNDPITEFQNDMAAKGLTCNRQIIDDGNIHRFHVYGDKPCSENGWYVFFGNAGCYGSWKTGEKFTWSLKEESARESAPLNFTIRQPRNRTKEVIDRYELNIDVAKSVKEKWDAAPAANPLHPYLKSKNTKPHNLRQDKYYLLVPLFDFQGTLWNLQTIYANGEKRFEKGGRVNGLFSPIGDVTSKIIICEGWATGASLHEVLGDFVLCAMNAGNLVKVAQGARKHFPDAQIIIAADNDRHTPGNPGLAKAKEAAHQIKASIILPVFPDGALGSDFNDLVSIGWNGALPCNQ